MRALSFLIAVAALSAAPTFAQDAPLPVTVGAPQVSPDDWDITEVTVVAKFKGPALWRVKRGNADDRTADDGRLDRLFKAIWI